MADTPGKDAPSTGPKPQDKTGPVKPPVLEGTARPAAAGKPAEQAGPGKTSASTEPKPEPAKPSPTPPKPAPSDNNGGSPWTAGLVGGALGLAAAYGLAWFGLWPTQPQTPPPADPRIAQFSAAIAELEAKTGTVESGIAAFEGRVSGMESTLAALPAEGTTPADIGLAEELAALTQRVETLASAATPATDQPAAAADTEALATLETALAQLRQQSEAQAARLQEVESQTAALAETASAITTSENQAARLPLIFSGLESAFAAGRTFEPELTALRQALPNAAIPEALSARAANGLPRPQDVARRLDAAIPDMLAGRPADADADWQSGAMDWVRGVVAMRPAGEVEGDGPDAIVARLEAAVARRDFTAAQTELTALPASMQAAAGAVAADIATLAEAEAFLAGLRSQALSGENGA